MFWGCLTPLFVDVDRLVRFVFGRCRFDRVRLGSSSIRECQLLLERTHENVSFVDTFGESLDDFDVRCDLLVLDVELFAKDVDDRSRLVVPYRR